MAFSVTSASAEEDPTAEADLAAVADGIRIPGSGPGPGEGQGGHRQSAQPPSRWPEHLLDLMDESACRRVIREARWEHGRVCPHCGSPDVELLVGQFTSGVCTSWGRNRPRRST